MINLRKKLSGSSRSTAAVYTIIAAFGTYSCMYAFRKPFAVAMFQDMTFLHIDYKIWLITAQVLGYTTSKFLGIRIISEMKQHNRHLLILMFVAVAEIALLLFAVVPKPYNILFLFFNGLPLGMIWGIVFSYLEGRRNTELLGAGLCTSFIFSSGMVKSTGKWLMLDFGVSEFWMPFVTGLIYMLPLVFFVFMLDQIPLPDEEDKMQRTERVPMRIADRKVMLKEHGFGLFMLILTYMGLTAFRDFRDNFAAEIWSALGYGSSADIFTLTEIPVSIGVLLITSLIVLIKDNLKALIINHYIIIFGFLLIGSSTLAFENGLTGPVTWVTLVGLGLYLGYVPFNSLLFERMIAAFRSVGNVGFLIYLADSFGYLGSVGTLFYKNFEAPALSWLSFFKTGAVVLSIAGSLLVVSSMFFFIRKQRKKSEQTDAVLVDYAIVEN